MTDVRKSRAWKTLSGLINEIQTYKDVNEAWADRTFLKIRQLLELANASNRYPHLLFICNLIVHSHLDRSANFLPLRQIISLSSDIPPDLGIPSPAMTGQIRWGNVLDEFHQFFRDFGFNGKHLYDRKIEDVICITTLEIVEGKEIGYSGDLSDLDKLKKVA